MLINLENIFKYYNGNLILKDINLTVENNDRIGLIGVNGCGKSTLLKLITGEEGFDKTQDGKGSIAVSTNTTIGILKQNSGLDKSNTIKQEMRTVFSDLLVIKEKMKTLEKEMSDQNVINDQKKYTAISEEYSKLSSYFEIRDGYNIDVKIKTILNGMGFENTPDNRIINTLSGGEKTRLALSKLLLENPDLLILDEPTNHLDFTTLSWLETYLQSYKGGLLIVSHDRYFLNKLCTRICEIENHVLTAYKGDYSSFVVQKEMRTERLIKEYEHQQEQISQLQTYIDKNKVRASTANMAKSRQAALDRIEIIDKPLAYNKMPKIRLEYDIVPPKEILKVDNVDIVAGSKKLIDSLSFEVRRGEKVAIVGPNGIGKSTVLKVLLNKYPHKNGKIFWCQNAKISYFEQENSQLNFNNTVMEELHRRHPSDSEQTVRSLLAKVLLNGENVFKRVSVISGGERAKLCFAIMMRERGNILILDEPTNHLDLRTKEVLEEALEAFDGTIIFVSHDRYLLNKIASRIIELDENSSKEYKGNFDFYSASKLEEQQEQQKQEDEIKAEKKKVSNAKVYRTKEQRALEANNKKLLKETEKQIELLEEKSITLQEEMTQPDICSDYVKMKEKCDEIEDVKKQITKLYEKWESLS